EFVRLGIHPTDPTGTRRIRAGDNDSYSWLSLFASHGEDVDWRDEYVRQDSLNLARQTLVSEMQRLVSGIVFSKTYFALEETGLGYPCIPSGTAGSAEDRVNAFLRVFADAYRLLDNPWGDDSRPQDRPPEWNDGRDIPPKDRVRRFALHLWPEDRVN